MLFKLKKKKKKNLPKPSLLVQTVKNLPAMQETQIQFLGEEDPQRSEWQLTPVFLPGEFRGQRSLLDKIHGLTKSWPQLSNSHTHT